MKYNNSESLLVQIGNTSDGKVVKCDFSSINNMLVSGTTGSGKTNFIYSLLYSLMENNVPRSVRFVIIGSNVSDYAPLNGSGFLLLPVVDDAREAARTIAIACEESAKRMEKRELNEYPHIFLIIDDLAKLSESEDIKNGLERYLGLTRLVKMHSILVTSIPTSAVIPSELKALIPYRVSFSTTSPHISRMVIGETGAESLRYPGEMIYKCGNQKLKLDATYMEDVRERILEVKGKSKLVEEYTFGIENNVRGLNLGPFDELTEDAIAYFLKAGQASVSMLQRRYRIGYNRAARIMDEIEEKGIIGPQEGSRPRQLLISEDEYFGSNCNNTNEISFDVVVEDAKEDRGDFLYDNIFASLTPEQQAKILDADFEDVFPVERIKELLNE